MIWKASLLCLALSMSRDKWTEASVHNVEVQVRSHHGIISRLKHPLTETHEAYAPPDPSYEFSYKVDDPHTRDIKEQREIGEGGNVSGDYWLVQPDGHRRDIKYKVDDKNGFVAVLNYSSPHSHVYYNVRKQNTRENGKKEAQGYYKVKPVTEKVENDDDSSEARKKYQSDKYPWVDIHNNNNKKQVEENDDESEQWKYNGYRHHDKEIKEQSKQQIPFKINEHGKLNHKDIYNHHQTPYKNINVGYNHPYHRNMENKKPEEWHRYEYVNENQKTYYDENDKLNAWLPEHKKQEEYKNIPERTFGAKHGLRNEKEKYENVYRNTEMMWPVTDKNIKNVHRLHEEISRTEPKKHDKTNDKNHYNLPRIYTYWDENQRPVHINSKWNSEEHKGKALDDNSSRKWKIHEKGATKPRHENQYEEKKYHEDIGNKKRERDHHLKEYDEEEKDIVYIKQSNEYGLRKNKAGNTRRDEVREERKQPNKHREINIYNHKETENFHHRPLNVYVFTPLPYIDRHRKSD